MGVWEQDCEPPPGCPTHGLEPAFCLLDPTPFTPTDVDGEVVAISVDADVLAALALPPGPWWTAWSDGVTCERVVAMFPVAAVTP